MPDALQQLHRVVERADARQDQLGGAVQVRSGLGHATGMFRRL